MDPPAGQPSDPPPRVSVVIPHLNTPELLHRALVALTRQTLSRGAFEILVVDNGSTVPLEPLKAAWPGVSFLSQAEPGPGPARNLGAAQARGELLAFTDADVRVAPGWLQAAVDALAQGPDTPVGGRILVDVRDARRMSAAEAFETVFSFDQQRYIVRDHYAVTANLAMSRATFEAAGPFGGIEESEDLAFGRRAHALGRPTRYAPEMLAWHPARPDLVALRAKWRRLSIQHLARHRADGGSTAAWRARAVTVALSSFAHAPRVLVARRLGGAGNRLAGLAGLFAIRWWRALDMWRLAGERRASAATSWNREAPST